ncbi:MAG: hypothetical protein WBN04_19815 [Paracoccaceae bacterium]
MRLPETGSLRRDMPAPASKRRKGYVENFDAHTLIYDCFYDDLARQVVLVCPRLLNLWPVLREGLTLNGQPVGGNLRRSKHLRFEVLRTAAPERPKDVGFSAEGHLFRIPVSRQDPDAFAGRNVLLAISKDNPIDWIEDWVRYHVSAHGANALILFDNGSTDYSPDDLQSRLSVISGVDACRVISAPFPYGGAGGGRLSVPAKFLQTALFNIARMRFLHRARAVLSVDIDELVWPQNGSVFDAAAKSRLGVITFFGHWVYPAHTGTAQPQRAHSMRLGHEPIPNPKWCIVPGSLADKFSWAIHRPAGLLYPFTIRRRFGLWHCFATSTNWKHNRTKSVPGLTPCPELTEALARHLPPGP